MHDQRPGQPQGPENRRGLFDTFRVPRHERIQRELDRTSQSRLPTWAYGVTLGVLVAAWILWIILS